MSDLSWLNPTPHAIAVYASQPLSPAATQHSLPSGRYSLLGPDFHRLDRASLAWRTYSMTSAAVICMISGTVRPRALAVLRIDRHLELGRLLDRDVSRLGAAQHLNLNRPPTVRNTLRFRISGLLTRHSCVRHAWLIAAADFGSSYSSKPCICCWCKGCLDLVSRSFCRSLTRSGTSPPWRRASPKSPNRLVRGKSCSSMIA